ncbi:MAG TPA: GAF domain-containing sensor histidine kinase [Candidatus Binatia bacterium]|nr:GAF domain-containing sensor histidine kinase [Candidatus Binatia bacterium]
MDLVHWMLVLRRIAVGVGILLLGTQSAILPEPDAVPVVLALLACVGGYNEAGRWLIERQAKERALVVVNALVALDSLTVIALLHLNGGIASPSVCFTALPFLASGAVLPLVQAFAHVAVMAVGLGVLAALESSGVLGHHAVAFYDPAAHQRLDFVAFIIVNATMLNAFVAYAANYLSALLVAQERNARELAAERGELLATNQREAEQIRALLASNERVYGRVRALLDVAQHVSGSHSVSALLHAVCDTTVALVCVPRVEIFLWDERRQLLHLAAARGLTRGAIGDEERHYPADVPIVAALRKGAVVDFGAAPAQPMAPKVTPPFRRGFAAPMVCRGSFEGALFVGYDEENTDELKELVQGIARQAAVALVNVRALEMQQEDADVSRKLLSISQALSACLDEDELWKLLVRGACQALELPWASANRFDEQTGTFQVAATMGFADEVAEGIADARFRLEDFPVLQELLSSRQVIVGDDANPRPFLKTRGWTMGSWIAVPLFRSNLVAGFVVFGDLAGRRTFSRRQMRLAEGIGHHASIALQNARLVASLEQADRLKSEFVSTMSHELRTPLNVIIGYTEMLREGAAGPVNEQQLDLIQRLDARGRELLELIEDTLLVGRLEAGRIALDLTSVALPDLVGTLQAATAGLPRPANVALEWEAPTSWDAPILTDQKKLALVVRNLVSNALKFTTDGKVLVRLAIRGTSLAVDVRDTGIGISAEHLPIIFDMFRQVDGSMTRRHGGVGLGLYIVKQFVSRLGGTIDVKSAPGRGSTFRVVLPGVTKGDDTGRERETPRRRLVAA